MNSIFGVEMEVNRRKITSVGIDIGTTTTHLVFSELILENDPFSTSNKLNVVERKILYKSPIHFTPLKKENTEIDTDKVASIIISEYNKAGINPFEVDTGAVIITGETSRKSNAEELVNKIADDSGKFIAASAGPHFESTISAHGSGAVEHSKQNQVNLIHTDIGGGTSNIAVIENGVIVQTASLNIGGRLIAYDQDIQITRIERTVRQYLDEKNRHIELGDTIPKDILEKVSKTMAEHLVNYLTGKNNDSRSPYLTGESLVLSGNYLYSFSGGVSNYIYERESNQFQDLGHLLGKEIRLQSKKHDLHLIELPENIRATVIGASSFTLQISGYTTHRTEGIALPLRNIPVVNPQISKNRTSVERVADEVKRGLKRMDIDEGSQIIAYAFKDPVHPKIESLTLFVKGIEKALSRTIEHNTPIILVFEKDIANSVANTMKRETKLDNILAIDEVNLSEGSFIDIGQSINDEKTYPVIIKSLIFSH